MAQTVLCMASVAVLRKCVSVVQTSGQGRAAGGGTPDFGSRIQSTLQNVGSTLQQSASRISRELPCLPCCSADTAPSSVLHLTEVQQVSQNCCSWLSAAAAKLAIYADFLVASC